MRVALFDWTTGGHHSRYLRKFAEALPNGALATIVAPESTLQELADLPCQLFSLGQPRPPVDLTKPLTPQHELLAAAELDHLGRAIDQIRPDLTVHMYGDHVIRWLLKRRAFKTKLSLLIFFARFHYASVYGSRLSPRERIRAWFQRGLLERWRLRPDAHSLFFLDRCAAKRFERDSGASGYWLPEPPVPELTSFPLDHKRSGLALYGALAPRKGIDLLADAVGSVAGKQWKITLAGAADPQFEPELHSLVKRMESAGAEALVRNWRHSEQEGLSVLAGAQCTVLPYPQHYGMSRVLLESCVAGTPVVVNSFGLLGHLVRSWGLGKAVDCRSPKQFRQALEEMVDDPSAKSSYGFNLVRFAQQYSQSNFAHCVATGLLRS